MNIDDLYTAIGYGKFKFKKGYDVCDVNVPSTSARISCGTREGLEATFRQELEAEVMDIAYRKLGNSWSLIESYPIITIRPSSDEEKIKVILQSIKDENQPK